MTKERKKLKPSFALVYVMLFTMMALVVITIIAGALVSNIKLQRSSIASIQTNALAKVAIDEALSKYKDMLSNPGGPSLAEIPYPDHLSDLEAAYFTSLEAAIPANACSTTPTYNIFINNDLQTGKTLAQIKTLVQGFPGDPATYAYRVCYKAASSIKLIEAIGYSKGFRASMKAEIKHPYNASGATVDEKIEPYKADFTRKDCNLVLGVLVCADKTGVCGTDNISDPMLLPCSDTTLECTQANECRISNIKFNHINDKLVITQTSL